MNKILIFYVVYTVSTSSWQHIPTEASVLHVQLFEHADCLFVGDHLL